jgi:hypothetical protein
MRSAMTRNMLTPSGAYLSRTSCLIDVSSTFFFSAYGLAAAKW